MPRDNPPVTIHIPPSTIITGISIEFFSEADCIICCDDSVEVCDNPKICELVDDEKSPVSVSIIEIGDGEGVVISAEVATGVAVGPEPVEGVGVGVGVAVDPELAEGVGVGVGVGGGVYKKVMGIPLLDSAFDVPVCVYRSNRT